MEGKNTVTDGGDEVIGLVPKVASMDEDEYLLQKPIYWRKVNESLKDETCSYLPTSL